MPTQTIDETVAAKDENIEVDKLLDFTQSRIELRRLIDDWKEEIEETCVRRDTRDVKVDVEALRESGELDEDETLVPVRVIDVNIQREQPAYINYLKNSRRLAIFHSLSQPDQDTQLLEQEFTRGMTYTGWETAFYKCIDGAQTHGWDAVEVVFDESKPLHVGIEPIGHDMLFFPLSAIDIQYCPQILRKYEVTLQQLDKFVARNGFNKSQVQKLKDARRDTQKALETISIYKRFFKKEGQVFIAWFCLEYGVDDWLLNPMPLSLGIKKHQTQIDPVTGQPTQVLVDAPVTTYPVFILPYRETEKPKLADHKGRVFLDEYKQEAHTAVLSGFINGLTRASNIYASPEKEDGTGSSLKELQNIKLKSGRIMNNPMRWFSPDYPDPMVIRAMQWFDVSNSQETNQVSFAAMNRQDSRKTATEIGAAQQEQALLNSVQLTLFSTFIRSIFSFAWLIVQSRALQDEIIFLRVSVQVPQQGITGDTLTGTNGQPVTETVWQNNKAVIAQTYDVRAAGDVDVIARQEKIQAMQTFWPIVSQTVLKDKFLADLLKLSFPDTGEQYAQLMETQGSQMQQMQSMIGRLATMLEGAVQQSPEMVQNLPPQQARDLQDALIQAKQMMPQTAQTA